MWKSDACRPRSSLFHFGSTLAAESSSYDLALLNTVVSHWLAVTVSALVKEDVGLLGCGIDSVRHPFRSQLTCLSITS